MRYALKIVWMFLAYLLACQSRQERQQWTVETEEGRIRLEQISDNTITIPFAMAFLSNDKMVISDRPKGEMIILDIESRAQTKVKGVPATNNEGDGGLLDILPHPDFKNNQELFYVYSFQSDLGFSLAVERATLSNYSLVNRARLFTAQPYFSRASFYGSRLLWKDGFLFISAGVDKSKQDTAQLLSNHLGKIMRIKDDGTVPNDNPFVGMAGALPEIWCYGTRNPQGLTINPYTNEIWEHEHGPKGGDEINIIKKGVNYGWPVITYGKEYDDTPVGDGITEKEGMEQPVYYYTPSIAPSGMVFYTGKKFPMWTANLFIGSMVLTHLNRSVIEGEKVVHEERILNDLKWRVRNVIQGPDGYLYIGVDGGMILRVSPE